MSIIDDLNAQLANVNKGISDIVEEIGVIDEGKMKASTLKANAESFSSTAKSSVQELTQITGRVSSPVKESFFEGIVDKIAGSGLADLNSSISESEGELDDKKRQCEQDKSDLEALVKSLTSKITEELNKVLKL